MSEALVEGRHAHALRAAWHNASEDGSGRGTPLVPMVDRGRVANTLCGRKEGSGNLNGTGQSPGLVPLARVISITPDAFDRTGEASSAIAADRPGLGIIEDETQALRAKRPGAVAYQCNGSNVGPLGTLRAGNGSTTGGVPFVATEAYQSTGPGSEAGAGPLAASDDNGSNQVVISLQDCRAIEKHQGGVGVRESGEAYTLDTTGSQGVAYRPPPGKSIIPEPIPLDMRQASRGEKMTNNRGPEASSGGAPGTGIGQPGDPSPALVQSHVPAIAFHLTQDPISGDCSPCLSRGSSEGAAMVGVALAIGENQRGEARLIDHSVSLTSGGGKPGQGYPAVLLFQERTRKDGRNLEAIPDEAYARREQGEGSRSQERNICDGDLIVRRLTPAECLRLQAMPDDWVDDLGLSDSAIYQLCGNAGTSTVLEWITRRLASSIREAEVAP